MYPVVTLVVIQAAESAASKVTATAKPGQEAGKLSAAEKKKRTELKKKPTAAAAADGK